MRQVYFLSGLYWMCLSIRSRPQELIYVDCSGRLPHEFPTFPQEPSRADQGPKASALAEIPPRLGGGRALSSTSSELGKKRLFGDPLPRDPLACASHIYAYRETTRAPPRPNVTSTVVSSFQLQKAPVPADTVVSLSSSSATSHAEPKQAAP